MSYLNDTNPNVTPRPEFIEASQKPEQKVTAPALPEIKFIFKQVEKPIEIELDLDALTWEDNLKFGQIQAKNDSGEMTDEEAFAALNELLTKITGRDVAKMPSRHVSAIITQIATMTNGEAEERKN